MIAQWAALLIAWTPAQGVEADPALAAWYQSLTLPGQGEGWCCSASDCAPRASRRGRAGWEIDWVDATHSVWLPVPDAVVILHKDNPTGMAVACIVNGAVRCFVAPPET